MGVLKVIYVAHHPTSASQLRVTFSEAANPTDAATAANYALDHSVTVSAAVVVSGSSNKQADITVSALSKSVAYKLTVSNVRDSATSTAITSANNQAVFIWLGVGDDNLDGVPEHGGLIARVTRANFKGDDALGYNVLGTTDTIPPSVENVSPTPGIQLDPSVPVSFDMVDKSGNLTRTLLFIYYPTLQRFEVVWFPEISGSWGSRAAGFGPQYLGTRTRVDATRYSFTGVIRKGGWPAPWVLVPDPIDDAGNEAA